MNCSEKLPVDSLSISTSSPCESLKKGDRVSIPVPDGAIWARVKSFFTGKQYVENKIFVVDKVYNKFIKITPIAKC